MSMGNIQKRLVHAELSRNSTQVWPPSFFHGVTTRWRFWVICSRKENEENLRVLQFVRHNNELLIGRDYKELLVGRIISFDGGNRSASAMANSGIKVKEDSMRYVYILQLLHVYNNCRMQSRTRC